MTRSLTQYVAALVLLGTAVGGCGSSDPTGDPSGRPEPEAGRLAAESATPTPADTPSSTPPSTPAPRTPSPSTAPREASRGALVPASTPPRAARSAKELAARLVAAEGAVRDPKTPEPQLRAAGFEAQVLYRQLARTRTWHRPVLAAVGADLRPVVKAQVAARRSLRGMHHSLSSTLPSWRIVEPAPAENLLEFYREGERTFGVPWEVLAAINLVETGMGRIRGTSSAGAQGPMQFMPATWAAFGRGDINDPRDAILAAARYLAHNGGGTGQVENALYRYNNHSGYVTAVRAYAEIMAGDPRAFHGFYHWQVLYLSEIGDIWLPVGYEQRRPVPARAHVAKHPEHHLGTQTN